MSNYQINLSLEEARKEPGVIHKVTVVFSVIDRHNQGKPLMDTEIVLYFYNENLYIGGQNEKNWQILNQLPDSLRKAMQATAAEHKANQMAFAEAGLSNPREKRESYLDQMFDSDHMKNGA